MAQKEERVRNTRRVGTVGYALPPQASWHTEVQQQQQRAKNDIKRNQRSHPWYLTDLHHMGAVTEPIRGNLFGELEPQHGAQADLVIKAQDTICSGGRIRLSGLHFDEVVQNEVLPDEAVSCARIRWKRSVAKRLRQIFSNLRPFQRTALQVGIA